MDKPAAFQAMVADLKSGDVAFSTSARVALGVLRALDDPDGHIDATVRLVQAEPLLAARIVAMANSVAYNRSNHEITDVRTSVQRLGFRTVRLLATALVTRQLASGAAERSIQDMATQLWQHTAHVASLARVIARRVTHIDPETALFAGIVHEVGGFYLLSRAKDFPGLIDGDFDEWTDGGEAQVGRAVLDLLDVPVTVMDAVSDLWAGYLEMPPRTLGDTLLLCNELVPVASPLGGVHRDESFKSTIDMVVGEQTLAGILEESAEEVATLAAALQF